MAQNKQMKSSKHKLKPIKLKAKAGDEEEVGQKYRQQTDGIVGVIFTLEHARGLVAGRSFSLAVEHWHGKP